ncbi:hypothetical protein EVAR_47794_1 [Eumeta japonica]|uniref:Uncharacterized protein n=1 Tax=Eumeta variegata TaxID=151549 RepID=A0A4C1ZCR3_EUMVA|nr:hypothetical protein EVAR_47794_1 [Eumeta japonica]
MGLMWSTVLSYAGILEALEFFKNITNGMIPEGDPDFRDLVEYYRSQLELRANSSAPSNDWIDESNHGYLYLIEDDRGKLHSASLKYYGNHPDSTAILFSTKISSFGQDSVESIISNNGKANGDYYTNRSERYPITTKTIVTNTSESFSVGQRSRSPTVSRDGVSDSNRCYDNRSKDNDDRDEQAENEEKLTWRYRPLSPSPTLPEIRFQSYDGDDKGVCDDEFLRSLDGIKFRPLQRNDPSGRRKTFRKRNSSSSTSSRDSRASREEELKMFTSLEEAEFKRIGRDENVPNYRSTPNLVVHSSSSGQQNCDEKTNETFVGNVDNEDSKTKLKDLPKLDSFEEETPAEPSVKENEVIEEEDLDDFWGNSGD